MSTKQQLATPRRTARLTPRVPQTSSPTVDLSIVPVPAAAAPSRVTADAARSTIPGHMRHEMIAVAAYMRAEARGFAPGNPVEDWLEAEREVDALIAARYV